MKFSCIQDNLNLGVNLVGHITSKSGSLPILNNLLIQCKPEGIYLSATNLEIGLKYLVRGKVIEEGEFTVPARLFSDYIGLLNDKIDVGLEEQVVKIESGTTSSKIKGLPAAEFPLLPKVEDGKKVTCKKADFVRLAEQVGFAASPNETRPELTGVYLKIDPKDQTATMAATDSYRLTEGKVAIKTESKEEVVIIIPGRTLLELTRVLNLIKGEGDELTLEIGSNQIVFLYDNVELLSRLIDGSYPDYAQIIPKEFKSEAKFSREAFLKAIKAASLFSRGGIYDVNLTVEPGKGIKIGSTNSQVGEQSTTVEAISTGEETTIVFNYHYLLDGLQAIKTPEINLQVIDSNNPCLFTPVSEKKDYLYIVMPIRQ